MPVNPTYPGVYIQEVDSGSRVVSGVATSITAFVGRAALGPANTATTVFDYGEFERLFGGRTRDLPMTYAVEDFFNNGGSQAVIVRVCAGPPLGTPATVQLIDGFTLTSVLKGVVANQMTLGAVPSKGATPDKPAFDLTLTLGPKVALATQTGVTPDTLMMTLNAMNQWFTVSGSLSGDQARTVLGVPAPAQAQQGGQQPAADQGGQQQPAADQGGQQQPAAGQGGQQPAAAQLAAKTWQFGATTKGADATILKAPTFEAGPLEISASVGGAWTDDLSVAIVPQGHGKFVFSADHPLFSQPYEVPFGSWDDLKSGLAPTNLFALNTPPAIQDIGAFVQKGVALTRMPDASGSAAALITFGPLVITASSPGAWGNQIGVFFDKKNISLAVAARFSDYGITDDADFWNINVVYPLKKGQTSFSAAETIGPVYLGPIDAPCRIDHVLAAESQFIDARQPVVAPQQSDLLLDPTQLGMPLQSDATKQIGVLSGGQDGTTLSSDIVVGSENARTGLYALEQADLFNILVIPPDPLLAGDADMISIYDEAASYCARKRAILIADPLLSWGVSANKSQFDKISPADLDIGELAARRSTFTYFPRVKKFDPEHGNQERVFSASGIIAGIFAATDVRRGVWKAPAGIEAGMNGVTALEYKLTDMQNGVLNQVGINVLRDFPVIGKVVWGSRTLAGADVLSDDYKYLPVRRLTYYVEESLYRGTKFAVFEPNAEPLWATLRLSVGSFMSDLARQGAFYDYYVRCDKSTTTQFDIDRGRVNVIVAFAPVKPAEFVILTIQQLAGQTAAA